MEAVRQLFRDYQTDIAVDLRFQSFDRELRSLPGKYDCVLLLEVEDRPAGCVALRPYAEGIAELKRLFVYPAARGFGFGKKLMQAAMQSARNLGYGRLHLDTLKSKMPSAVVLYQALGFVEVPAKQGGIRLPDLMDMELELTVSPSEEGEA